MFSLGKFPLMAGKSHSLLRGKLTSFSSNVCERLWEEGREGVGGDGPDTQFLARRDKLHGPALLWESCPAGVPGGSDGSSEPRYEAALQ